MTTKRLVPDRPLQGEVQVPGSKSIAQRALAAAAFAHGTTELHGLPSSQDVVHALRCARSVGATFPSDERPDDLFVTALLRRRGHGRLAGAPPLAGEPARPWCVAEVGESGTTARLYSALLALGRPLGSGAEVRPTGTLEKRRSPALFRALRQAGVAVEHGGDTPGDWPVLLTSATPPELLTLVEPSSSQEVTALLFALATQVTRRELHVEGRIPSASYLELSLQTLRVFGVDVTRQTLPWGERFTVLGPLRAPAEPLEVEADASAAAVALAAGCLSGGEVVVPGIGSASCQPDLGVLDVLRAFGCSAYAEQDRLVATGSPSRGAELDLGATPDVAPVAAAVAAAAALHGGGASRLTGLGTLPGKESSRIEVLVRGLGAAGFMADGGADWLSVAAPQSALPTGDVVLDPEGDHRMAFAFALVSLLVPNVRVADPNCVDKSWPTFWNDLN